MKALNTGDFDQRISLIPPKSTQRTGTGFVEGVVTGTPVLVWCFREENLKTNTKEEDIEMQFVAKKVTNFVIRYRENVGLLWTVQDRHGDTYNIEAIEEMDRRKLLRLRCELIKHDN